VLEDNELCKKCAICCVGTEMILTRGDIKRLEEAGYRGFYRLSGGFYRLRNVRGRCVFLGDDNLCRIYSIRPKGCRVYPLIYDQERGVVLDPLCPLHQDISCSELLRGVGELREVLEELEQDYGFVVDWGLFKASVASLLSRCLELDGAVRSTQHDQTG
jgi:Fe-S-cluster containining protein